MSTTTVQPYHGSYLMPSLEHATVSDAMHPGILTCETDATLTDVARLMATHHVHYVAVMGLSHEGPGEKRVWGIITDSDLVRAGIGDGADQTAAALAAADYGQRRADDAVARGWRADARQRRDARRRHRSCRPAPDRDPLDARHRRRARLGRGLSRRDQGVSELRGVGAPRARARALELRSRRHRRSGGRERRRPSAHRPHATQLNVDVVVHAAMQLAHRNQELGGVSSLQLAVDSRPVAQRAHLLRSGEDALSRAGKLASSLAASPQSISRVCVRGPRVRSQD